MMQFWGGWIKCARCEAEAECEVVQRAQDGSMQGALPGGWVGVTFMEKVPQVATSPQQAMIQKAQYRPLTMPCCSEACATELIMTRALELARTKNEKVTLVERFQALLGEPKAKKK
jgi:hypothetical protein